MNTHPNEPGEVHKEQCQNQNEEQLLVADLIKSRNAMIEPFLKLGHTSESGDMVGELILGITLGIEKLKNLMDAGIIWITPQQHRDIGVGVEKTRPIPLRRQLSCLNAFTADEQETISDKKELARAQRYLKKSLGRKVTQVETKAHIELQISRREKLCAALEEAIQSGKIHIPRDEYDRIESHILATEAMQDK